MQRDVRHGRCWLLDAFPEMAPTDEAFMRQAAGVQFMATFAETLRQGMVGYAQDLAVEAQAWAFDPREIQPPVRVLHGDADTLVPIAQPRHTVSLVATATLDLRDEEGHISLLGEVPRLAAELVAPLRTR